MKKYLAKKIVLYTLKIKNLAGHRPSGGSGRCPKNLQGTGPLTPFLGAAQTRPCRKQEKGAAAPFPDKRIIRGPYVKGLSRHNGAPAPLCHGPLDNSPAPLTAWQIYGQFHRGLTFLWIPVWKPVPRASG